MMIRTSLVLVPMLSLAVACKGGDDAKSTEATAAASAPPAKASPAPGAPAAVGPEGIPAPPDVASAPADAVKTASGLASKVLTPGQGTERPGANDEVTVNYTGWTTDGKMFDSSLTRKRPATFRLSQVIPGWTEGVQLMVPGEKRRFWIPGKLAYGETPRRPGAPAGHPSHRSPPTISRSRRPPPRRRSPASSTRC
jgi:hypothetical protein